MGAKLDTAAAAGLDPVGPNAVLVDRYLLDATDLGEFQWFFDRVAGTGIDEPPRLRYLGLPVHPTRLPALAVTSSAGPDDTWHVEGCVTGCIVAASHDAASEFNENPRWYKDEVLLVACEQRSPETLTPTWQRVVSRGGGVVGRVGKLFSVAVGLQENGFFSVASSPEQRQPPTAESNVDQATVHLLQEVARLSERGPRVGYGPARLPVVPEAVEKLASRSRGKPPRLHSTWLCFSVRDGSGRRSNRSL
jgi:hypothetical protein